MGCNEHVNGRWCGGGGSLWNGRSHGKGIVIDMYFLWQCLVIAALVINAYQYLVVCIYCHPFSAKAFQSNSVVKLKPLNIR